MALREQYQSPDYAYGDQASPPRIESRTYFIPIRSVTGEMAREHLERLYIYFSLYGAAFLAVGVIAIVLSLVFVLSVQQMVAWILVIGGALGFLHFMLVFGAPGTTSFLLLGILHLGIGLWFVIQPSITRGSSFVWILMGWFILHGLFKVLMAFQVRNVTSWPALLVAGIVSIILGFTNLALTGRYVGLLFGIDLAISGLSFFSISSMAYLASRAAATREPLLQEQRQTRSFA